MKDPWLPLSPFVRSLLFSLPPETAHQLAVFAFKLRGRYSPPHPVESSGGACQYLGLSFPNPLGLAAGFDKDAECIDGLAKFGFGFIEVGTVTPNPQPGNPKPRLFRLPEQQAIINRFGFNSCGVDKVAKRLKNRSYKGVVGVNIGKNKETPNDRAIEDYLRCLRAVYDCSDYISVNLSSPNTPGLRELQSAKRAKALMTGLLEERARLADQYGKKVPLLAKISPDLNLAELDRLVSEMAEIGLEGILATNTTIDHSSVPANRSQVGGLSGAPLHQKSLAAIKQTRASVGNKLVIIGVGGIMTPSQAADTLKAGADLMQIYTGFVYHGPALVRSILDSLGRAKANHQKTPEAGLAGANALG